MNADAILSAFICVHLRFKKSSCYFIEILVAFGLMIVQTLNI